MKRSSRPIWILLWILAALLLLSLFAFLFFRFGPYGYAREVPPREMSNRALVLYYAEGWLGANEADGSHKAIIDLYNAHTPLAQNYMVQYDDEWCSTFASAAAIASGMTDIIPTECGCERHIGLFMEMDAWVEDDSYVPLPGDYIFYCWDDNGIGDCTGWSSHVGIVVGTLGPFIKVIEGNRNEEAAYRYVLINSPGIRGFGTPDYSSIS